MKAFCSQVTNALEELRAPISELTCFGDDDSVLIVRRREVPVVTDDLVLVEALLRSISSSTPQHTLGAPSRYSNLATRNVAETCYWLLYEQ